ncbi:unnamed protein product [Amoebophrya sp. A25]|nr:unnamed protein product [Amoebophrya sp. A25]|eukprot:GSA25T00009897001.1
MNYFVDASVSRRRLEKTRSLVFSVNVWECWSTSSGKKVALAPDDGPRSPKSSLRAAFAKIREHSKLFSLKDQAVEDRLLRVIGGPPVCEDNVSFFRHLLRSEPGLPGYHRLLRKALRCQVSSLHEFLARKENWIYSKALQSSKGTFDDHCTFDSFLRQFVQDNGSNGDEGSMAPNGLQEKLSRALPSRSAVPSSLTTVSLSTVPSSVLSSRMNHKQEQTSSERSSSWSYGMLLRGRPQARDALIANNKERCGVFFLDEPFAVLQRARHRRELFLKCLRAYVDTDTY